LGIPGPRMRVMQCISASHFRHKVQGLTSLLAVLVYDSVAVLRAGRSISQTEER
jgi:hypothetical protein